MLRAAASGAVSTPKGKRMAKTYEQVLKKIETLKAEAERARQKETAEVVARIREAIEHYGLTPADLGLAAAPRRGRAAGPKAAPAKKGRRAAAKAAKKGSVPVKYRDDAGHTWTGRGLQPVWLREALAAGKTLQDFAVS
jgi:DNA-binding protein H-NS